MENYYGPVGVVYYRLMAAWAKERGLPPSVTLSQSSVTEGVVKMGLYGVLHRYG